MARKKTAAPAAAAPVAQTVKPRVRVTTAGYTRPVVPQSPVGFRVSNSVYEAAGAGPRSSSWQQAGMTGPAGLMARSLDTLRNRARYQVRNDPVASRIVDFIIGSVVGDGLRPMLKPGLVDPKFEEARQAFWEQCDADGIMDFDGLVGLATYEMVTGGDSFARMRPRDPDLDKDLVVPLQIQILPGEMVPSHDPTMESVSGIILDGLGRRRRYKAYNRHPGESLLNSAAGVATLSYIDAKDMCHLFIKTQSGQHRGEPWLTRGLIALHDLDAYQDAELVRKKMAAMPVFFIQTPTDTQRQPGPTGVSDGTDGLEAGTPINADGSEWVAEDPVAIMPQLAPGAVIPVAPGWEVKPSIPADVGPGYDSFMRRQLQRVCNAANVPYELVTGDTPSGANERMMRLRVQSYYQMVRRWRRMLIRQFCTPVWNRFIDALVSTGWEPATGTVTDYRRVEWVGDPVPQTHPTQDVQSDIMSIRSGIKTLSQVIRERGGDPDRVMAQRADELRKLDGLNIMTDSDPRYVSGAGVTQSRQGEFTLPDAGGADPDAIDL